jgi:hypothetical protein
MFLNSKKDGLGYMENNIVSLVIINMFDPDPILVIINKYKPYMFIRYNKRCPCMLSDFTRF